MTDRTRGLHQLRDKIMGAYAPDVFLWLMSVPVSRLTRMASTAGNLCLK